MAFKGVREGVEVQRSQHIPVGAVVCLGGKCPGGSCPQAMSGGQCSSGQCLAGKRVLRESQFGELL